MDDNTTRDHFDRLFKEFSKAHSWYKGVRDHKTGEYWFQFVRTDSGDDFTIGYLGEKGHIKLNGGLLCARYDQRGLDIALEVGGLRFLETLANRGYDLAIELLTACKMQGCRNPYELDIHTQNAFELHSLYSGRWKDMVIKEYERMRKYAREQFFHFMHDLYQNVLKHQKDATTTSSFAKRVSSHYDAIRCALQNSLPPTIVDHVVLLYHHIYD